MLPLDPSKKILSLIATASVPIYYFMTIINQEWFAKQWVYTVHMMSFFTLQKDFPYNINIPTLTNPTAKTPPSPMPKLLPTATPLSGFDEPLPVTRVDGIASMEPVLVATRVGVVLVVTGSVLVVTGSVDVALSPGESCIRVSWD
jgi:hypothetical protein